MSNAVMGRRVRDRYKIPRPGAECVTGKVILVAGDSVTVRMDDGTIKAMPRDAFDVMFTRAAGSPRGHRGWGRTPDQR